MVGSYVETLGYKIQELQARGSVGLSVFVGKNNDASLENLAQDIFAHIEATTSSEGVDIASLRI